MADNILYFEIASLPIFVLLLSSTFLRKMTKGKSNVLLTSIIILAFVAALSDTIGNLVGKRLPLNDTGVIAITVANYIYFFARCGMNAAYTYYLFAVTRSWYIIRSFWKRLLILVPFIMSMEMLLFNSITGDIFTVNHELGYQRGDKILVIYGLAAIYMVFGFIYLGVRKKLLNHAEWLAITMLYVFNVVGVVIQYFFSTLLIECYFTSVTLLFIVICVQKPERKVDMNTSLPGYFAFKEEMAKIQATGQKVQVVITSITNAADLYRYLGEKTYFEYIHTMNRAMESLAKQEKLMYDCFFETPGIFYAIIENLDYNPVQAISEVRDKVRTISGNVSATGIKPDAKVVSVVFPDDIDNLEELLKFGHDYVRFASGKIFCHATSITEQRNYQIEVNLEDIINRAIDNQKLEIVLLPVWSVIREKMLFAEAIISVCDEVFGEIETETLEEALRARGTDAIFEEYVLDQVFSYVGNGNLAKSGMSYVVVHLSISMGMQTNFTDRIWKLRGKYNVHPEQICFAIKESGNEIMGEAFDENIKKLSLQGYRIALDGYGNGYSNVKHIAELPISSVRLDKNLVDEADTGSGRAVLSGTIRMLTSIPLMVVAGGIDDEKTKDMLFNMGCDLMQGKYFEEKYKEQMGDLM